MGIQAMVAGSNRDTAKVARLLTAREWDVVQLMAEGRTNREISRALYISLETARWHAKNILCKLDLHRRAQVAAWWHGLTARPPREPVLPPQAIPAPC